MNLRVLAALALLALVPAANAEEIVISIENRATQAISSLQVFAVEAGGVIGTKKLGGFTEDVPPLAITTIGLDTETCGPVNLKATMADNSALETTIDTCKRHMLVVRD